jgi:hypothetical protein
MNGGIAMNRLLATLFPLAAAACAPFVPVQNLEDLPAAERAALDALPVYTSAEAAKRKHAPLGPVEGYSCKLMLWDPDPTQAAAIRQLKHWARHKGANAIANVACGSADGFSLVKNCWDSIRCTADAIRVEK